MINSSDVNTIGTDIFRIISIAFVMMATVLFWGCRSTEMSALEELDRGYYQNHALSLHVRNQVKNSFDAVRRIHSSIIYRTYQISENGVELPTQSAIRHLDLEQISSNITVDTHTSAGTAVVVSIVNRRALMLTAAHVVSYPDTVFHFTGDKNWQGESTVYAVSVTQSKSQFVFTDKGIESIEILASDSRRDLALMSTLSDISDTDLKNLTIPIGDPNRLDWTDVVYAVGYPRGVQMVTRGIASISDHPIRRITVDLSMNRGFSGGPLFAIRNDGSGLEWVGTVTSALGEREVYLSPESLPNDEYSSTIPYEGALYVKNSPRIFYGITNAVGLNEAQDFFDENRGIFRSKGFSINPFR
ncbi:MAG: serine protease [Balneolaceae bacterium]